MRKLYPAILSLMIPLAACEEKPTSQISLPLPAPSRVSTATPTPAKSGLPSPGTSTALPTGSPSPTIVASASPSSTSSASPTPSATPTPSVTPIPEQLTIKSYPQENSNSPYKEIINGKGDRWMFWASTNAEGVLAPSQARYATTSDTIYRVFYNKNGVIERIQNEKSGEFLFIEAKEDAFTLKVYTAGAKFDSGFRITQSNGKYYSSPLTGRPYFTGQAALDMQGGSQPVAVVVLPEQDNLVGQATEVSGKLEDFINRSGLLPGSFTTQDVASGTPFASGFARSNVGTNMALAGLLGPKLSSSMLTSTGNTLAGPLLDVGLVAASIWQTANTMTGVGANLKSDTVARFEANKSSADIVKDQVELINTAGSLTDSKNPIVTAPGKLEGALSPKTDTAKLKAPTDLPLSGSKVTGFSVDQNGLTMDLSGYVTSTGLLTLSGSSGGNSLSITSLATNRLTSGSFSGYVGSGSYIGLVTPLGTCNEQEISGGKGTFLRAHNIGQGSDAIGSGTTVFSYDAYSIPDQFTVFTRTGKKFGTPGLVSGGNTANIPVPNDWIVIVSVNAPQSGTAWQYELSCPVP